MSIRRTTMSEMPVQLPKADHGKKPEHANGKPEHANGKKEQQPTPHINQLRPRGADKDYVNGAYNCAPAVVAMLARAKGEKSNLTDAQLITDLGSGIVTKDGTTPEGVARMLGRANIPLAGDALAGQYDDKAVKQHLQDGNKVIAQIGVAGEKGKPDSAHYVLVQGQTRDGNYVVSDPLASYPRIVTPDQLRTAVNRAPPDGGLLIPVGEGGGSKTATTTPAPGAPLAGEQTVLPGRAVTQPAVPVADGSTFAPALARRMTDPSMQAVGPMPMAPGFARTVTDPSMQAVGPMPMAPSFGRAVTDPSMPVVDSESFAPTLGRSVSQTTMPEIDPATLLQQPSASGGNVVPLMGPALPALNPATLAVTRRGFAEPGLASPGAAGPAPLGTGTAAPTPSADPFAVSDKVLAGVDTTFHELPVEKADTKLTTAEKANVAQLDITYGSKDAPAPAKETKPLVPEDVDVEDYGKKLRSRRSKKDSDVNKFLERLESSHHGRDKQLLKWMKRQDLHDPGTGKKTWTESW